MASKAQRKKALRSFQAVKSKAYRKARAKAGNPIDRKSIKAYIGGRVNPR